MISEKNMMHGVDYLNEDVARWLMSEKLDGCRAYWDGSAMWSRGGKLINIPDVMRDALPADVHLDGELFAGRDGFEIARRFVQYGQWNDRIQFCVFDAPKIPGRFSDRYQYLEGLLPAAGVVNYIQHMLCHDIHDAINYLNEIQECLAGEGVMLRDPLALYVTGRVDTVLKLKGRPESC